MTKFKVNFRNGSEDIQCPFGCLHDDSQDLILKCPVLTSHMPELMSTKIQYKDIFTKNISKIKMTIELLTKAFIKREKLIELKENLQK